MHRMIQLAYSHHAYPGFGYHHGYGGGGWIANMAISAVVHSLIYSVVFRMMRHLTLPEAILLVGVVLALLFAWSRSRDRRGW